jgi:exodeoxyribonuclease V beta subunit
MTTAVQPAEFDLCGPLPSGVIVLEASAGTGKTYTIAALAARYVAEGMPLDRLLLITFTRMATGELRDRVRERLVHTEHELSRILSGAPDPNTDPIVALLAAGAEHEIKQRRDHLERAVADFDAATIATTHGFCQEVLAELGTVGDLEPGTVFVEDVAELVEEALDDFYVRRFYGGHPIAFNRAEALTIARAAIFNPMAALEPQDEPEQSTAAMRYRLASRIRDEVERRKRRLAVMTYDDLLTRLKRTLDGPNGDAAKERLRSRFKVVLVDEFQDTDPIQWQILHRAFVTQGVTLVLIADPKQAIYSFRGADVYAYLVAAATADTQATLRVNRRSDQPLLDAYDALFDGATLGHRGIVYRQVRADPAHQDSRLIGAPSDAALRVRVVRRDQPSIAQTNYGYAGAPSAREHISRDLAADVVELLSSHAQIEHRQPTGATPKDIAPGDVAVLVRTHANAELVRAALQDANVPAVINGAGSVFATSAASDWLRLLEAIERPSSALRAKTAALGAFFGWSAYRIASASERDWEEVHRRLHGWNRVLRDSGVAALLQAVLVGQDLPAQLLAVTGGERRLTDLRHLGQLLHQAARAEHLGVTALRGWLAQRIAQAEDETQEEELTRRIESDTEAVQVLTIHRSKGLEFPVVYCPFLWDAYVPRGDEPVLYHDPDAGDACTVDVGLEQPTYRKHKRQNLIERRGEELRMAYVALTRAKHQAVIWWAGSYDSRHSPLSRLLFARDDSGNVMPDGGSTPTDNAALDRFTQLAAAAPPGRIEVNESVLGLPVSWSPPLAQTLDLEAARFDRRLDLGWRRTSYSDITAESHDALVASEPEEVEVVDEPESAVAPEADTATEASPALRQASPLSELPVGVQFGTFVHRVLERTNFAAADLEAELAQHAAATTTRGGFALANPAQAITGLRLAIETPLGPVADGRRLRDAARQDRLDELAFEFPLVGGDDPTGRLTLDAIAGVLRAHTAADDPIAAYAERLDDPMLRSAVRGFLTGSIDLVLRLSGPRFAIVDYKTNWLGPLDQELTLAQYQPRALVQEMARAHYGLQALLYTVALHRYLRWRLAGYDPDTHLAGVLYLFLRGMAGAETPVIAGNPCGVFAWRPSGALVRALSDVLDRGAR